MSGKRRSPNASLPVVMSMKPGVEYDLGNLGKDFVILDNRHSNKEVPKVEFQPGSEYLLVFTLVLMAGRLVQLADLVINKGVDAASILTLFSTLLLPFTDAVVPTVDIAGGRVVIDLPKEIDGEDKDEGPDYAVAEDLLGRELPFGRGSGEGGQVLREQSRGTAQFQSVSAPDEDSSIRQDGGGSEGDGGQRHERGHEDRTRLDKGTTTHGGPPLPAVARSAPR